MQAFAQSMENIARELRTQATLLSSQTRQDEANLLKIRANIYEIAATIGNVACKTQPEDRREAVYLEKLQALPQNWRASLDAARTHNDGTRVAVEELKLEALEDVISRFRSWKGA